MGHVQPHTLKMIVSMALLHGCSPCTAAPSVSPSSSFYVSLYLCEPLMTSFGMGVLVLVCLLHPAGTTSPQCSSRAPVDSCLSLEFGPGQEHSSFSKYLRN